MNRKILFYLALAVVLFVIAYSLSINDDSAYLEEIRIAREEKVNFLCLGSDSPVKNAINRSAFDFFEPASEYKVKASLVEIPDVGRVEIATNDGTMRPYIKFALAVFEIDGHMDSLTIFIEPTFNADFKKAFIPFRDETNGDSSYGAGRYLDAEIKNDESIILDFNLAYNPYCAYSEEFICPLPPEENFINMRVEAGEKNYDSLH
jgi:hypothetical protein